MISLKKVQCLSNNMLKLIGCFFMVIDHVGVLLYPQITFLRILGRLAFPIFFFMLAEGCFYTKNRLKHLLLPAGFGVLMQIVLYYATGMTDFSIFLVFTCSIILIDLYEDSLRAFAKKKYLLSLLCLLLLILSLAGLYLLTRKVDYFESNYGYFGIVTPLLLYISKRHLPQNIYIFADIFIFFAALYLEILVTGMTLNYYALFAFVFLLLYNGKPGRRKMKYFFYFFYPIHFVALYGIYLIFFVK